MSITERLFEKLGDRIVAAVDRSRVELAAGLTETHNGLRITGARPRALPATSQLSWGGPGRLVGWSARADGGPVRVLFRDGRDGVGDVIGIVDLVDDEHETVWLGPTGVTFGEALYLELTGAGTLTGSAFLGGVD